MASRYGRVRNAYWGAFILDWFKHLQDHELSAADYRILFYLGEKMMTDDNTARVRQKTIAQDLAMDKGNVSKCLKKLCAKQFIAKAPDGYMVNPHLFYAGNGYANRYNLRDSFERLLIESPRFFLNEDLRILEVLDDNDDLGKWKPPF
ncbi:MarR family transcriptional regulator [Brevibacillus sp. 7WMA2]|uniref:MarR family transcriptional regulator n=1 Tax=Brevibacillus sp. 7WMA2 TaxID=2683193 RepID=UPI0013A74CB1|nr:helix-turn-helix domain-containing protein [Brevibacillus sp. 7WMA2]QIC07177.1 MarR family transcriptional regulator [Brevibacillus sp. 7WMA2]